MKKFRFLAMAAALTAAAVMTGCSDKQNGSQGKNSKRDFADSVSMALVQEIEQAQLARATAAVGDEWAGDIAVSEEMMLVDSLLYVIDGSELGIYNLGSKTEQRIQAGEPLSAMTVHGGKVLVGGASLSEVTDGTLVPVEAEFGGTITELYSFGTRLMIGTTEGLYAKSADGIEALFDEIEVSALAADNDGLWVGTEGQGLYRWNGTEFSRRFLLRDTSVFDYVNAMDYNHGHLFVGTDDALYVFNGGSWETITTEQGLPSNKVNAIDASNWVVYVATPSGVVSWFDYKIEPVAKLDGVNAIAVCARGNKVIAATLEEGVLMKSGPVVTTLIEPETEPVETAEVPDEPVAVTIPAE